MQTSQRPAWTLLFAAVAMGLALVSCSQDDPGTATTTEASASRVDGGRCATVAAPVDDIPPRNDGEPRLRIPVPDGWEYDDVASLTIRYAIAATDAVPANAIVTLEALQSPAPPAAVFERARVNLEIGGASDLTAESATTCGFPSETVQYMAPPALQHPPVLRGPDRPTLMRAVYVEDSGAQYLATLTIQTADAADAKYISDSQQIVDGLQIDLPGS